MVGAGKAPRLAEQDVVRRVDDTVRRTLGPATVGSEIPGLAVILEARAQQTAESRVQRRIFDRSNCLHTTVEIAPHPIGGANVELFRVAVAEVEDARVFEEAPDDADDADALAQPGHARPQ